VHRLRRTAKAVLTPPQMARIADAAWALDRGGLIGSLAISA